MADLRKLAEAATRGKWKAVTESINEHWRGDGTEVASEYGRIAECACNGLRLPEHCRANAAYIAAASPDRILALLDVVDKARALLPVLDGKLFEEGPEEVALRTALAALDGKGK